MAIKIKSLCTTVCIFSISGGPYNFKVKQKVPCPENTTTTNHQPPTAEAAAVSHSLDIENCVFFFFLCVNASSKRMSYTKGNQERNTQRNKISNKESGKQHKRRRKKEALVLRVSFFFLLFVFLKRSFTCAQSLT